jgi:hypothetical protein
MRCQHVDDDTQCRMDAVRRCSSPVATHRTQIRRGSRGPSTWSRSARSTTTTPTPAVDAVAASSRFRADRRTVAVGAGHEAQCMTATTRQDKPDPTVGPDRMPGPNRLIGTG